MRASLQKLAMVTATAFVVAGASATVPTSAEARWDGGWQVVAGMAAMADGDGADLA